MTKTDLITAINTQLTAIITQAKVRLASLQLVNELYSTFIKERYNVIGNTLLVTNFLNEDVFYEINFSKQGNKVFVNGFINNTSSLIFYGSFLEIIQNEYKQKTDSKQYSVTSDNGVLTVFNDTFIISDIGAGQKKYFNFNYQTND